jgi:hypothetical protein
MEINRKQAEAEYKKKRPRTVPSVDGGRHLSFRPSDSPRLSYGFILTRGVSSTWIAFRTCMLVKYAHET